MKKQLKISVTLDLSDDVFEQSEQIATMRPIIEQLREALPSAALLVHDVTSARSGKVGRPRKKKIEAVAA